MILKKYIGDKAFYKYVLGIAIPIMLQNLITNFVNLVDNLMVGFLGTEEVAAVAIVNQLIFIYNLTLFGAVSGAGIFATQYFGKKDYEGVRHCIHYKVMACGLVSILFGAAFVFFGDFIIGQFVNDSGQNYDLVKTMTLARQYLNIIVIGFIPVSICQIYASTLKESGNTLVPMLAGLAALFINTFVNAMLIFGIGPFQKLGVVGAAIGTTVSRVAECSIVLVYVYKNINRHHCFKGAFRSLYIPSSALSVFLKKGIPLLMNEAIWSAGMSLLTLAYSRYGLAVVAAQSISSTILNFFNMAFKSIGFSVGIVAGIRLGAGQFEEAVDEVRKLNAFSIGVSILVGIVVYFFADYILMLYDVSAEAGALALFFIKISVFFMPFFSYENSAYFTLRSGGKIFITFLMDGLYVILLPVPIAFLLQNFVPVQVTFVVVQALSIVKATAGYILIKRRTWVRNIVAE